MLLQLWLPIVLSGVALFFASFVSWMVVKLHKADWRRMPREDDFQKTIESWGLERGASYMFPMTDDPEEMKRPEFVEKYQRGPCGVITVFAQNNMGQNLQRTFLAFLVASFCLAYLGTIALPAGVDSLTVFRFFATASLLTFVTSIVQHAIWFKIRIVGHLIESVAYALIVGTIFALLWPQA